MCPKSAILTNRPNYWMGWGWVGHSYFAGYHGSFWWGALSKCFSGKDGSAPPRKKLARTPMIAPPSLSRDVVEYLFVSN